MRKFRLIALLCALFIAASLFAGCSGGPTVAKVGGEAISVSELNMFANFLLLQQQAGTVADIDDADQLKQLYDDALDTAITYRLLMKKGIERKLYPLSDAKRKEVDDQISEYLDSQLQAKITEYTQSGKSEKDARAAFYDDMKKSGLTRENLTTILRYAAVAEVFYNEMVDAATVSDEDLQAGYEKKVAEQKEQFTADPASFENAKMMADYYGTAMVYRPEGYRYVKHILIAFPEDITAKIEEAQNNGDEAAVKKAREEGLPLIKAKADEVLAKVKTGQDFDSLVAEFGEDPGMQQEPAKTKGYELGESTSFVEEFKQAALKLPNVGDVTELVATDFGYHIIKWVGNVPSGPVPLEDVKDTLKEELLTEKQNTAWEALVAQLKQEYKVEQFTDKYPTLAPAASAPAGTQAPAVG